MPTCLIVAGKGLIVGSSTRMETYGLPEGFRLTVTLEGWTPSGRGRLQRIGRGPEHLARKTWPSLSLNPDLVYFADPLLRFLLKLGYFPSPKEVGEGGLEVAQGLLEGNGRNLVQEPEVFLLFPAREHLIGLVAGDCFPSLRPCPAASIQSLVVDKKHTARVCLNRFSCSGVG